MPKRKLSKRSKSVPKIASFHIFILIAGVILVVLVGRVNLNSTKQSSSSFTSPNVLGENQEVKKVLVACSSGGLTTSTNKVFQMTYPNETFLQLINIDLLKDVSQLKDLTCLQYLDATDRNVKGDITNLKSLTNLEVFTLFSNPEVYGDICSLSRTTKLRSLKFAFDPKITGNIACLKNLTKLETFAMTHTQLSGDMSVFANMPNLKAIYINGTNIKGNICSLSKLTNLEELGISDEAGNTGITGDLSCLDNLQKLKRVSIYNTSATNCEQFTKSHPNIAQMEETGSGRKAGGGCSKESLKTLVDVAQKYEKKIGKDALTEVQQQLNYNQNASSNISIRSDNRNFLTKVFDWLRSVFSRSSQPALIQEKRGAENLNKIRPQSGPGGCKSQAECDLYCDKLENREECSKFAPPNRERPSL